MDQETLSPLRLSEKHLGLLTGAEECGVVGAEIYRRGRFHAEGFVLYGELEFLAGCGLLEFIVRAGKPNVPPGDVWMYYYPTRRGRLLSRWWRSSPETVGEAWPLTTPPRLAPGRGGPGRPVQVGPALPA